VSNLKQIFRIAAAAALLQCGIASAQESLDDLLKQVQSVRQTVEQQLKERADEFNTSPADQQQKMLADAQGKRDALAATADKLAAQFLTNEQAINDANKNLQEKAKALGLSEIFGLARQVAGDTATTLQQSMTSTQFPAKPGEMDRDDFLRSFAASKTTPNTSELTRVWEELQTEMTASSQVARYKARVVQPGGEPVEASVTRIGPFTATSDGKYLKYLPDLQLFSVYPRQPPDEFLDVAREFEPASGGYAKAVVDGTRGVLMDLYVERPTWEQRVEMGEEIGYIIIVVGAVAFIAFLFQLVYLLITRMAVGAQLKHLDRPSTNNPLGRVLLAFKGDANTIEQEADVAELRIAEAVFREVPKLERFQALLRLGVAAGPLLGLIGTVVGMIFTFQSITESGSSDPKLMAGGIGQAMIATVLGLGIAIPLLFANTLLVALSRGVTQIIEEQSAGMLAESIEKQRRV
jgi:biopolymer transport protein ExbB